MSSSKGIMIIFVLILPLILCNYMRNNNYIRNGINNNDKDIDISNTSANRGKVSIIGAGFYGSQTAFRLAQYDIFHSIVLTDIVEDRSEGIALDINQSSSIEGFTTNIIGTTTIGDKGYEMTADSDIIIITAGIPRKPGMSRSDLININTKIITSVVTNVVKYSPNAVIIVVSNPLDEMTALTQIVSKFPANRVIGQAGVLDSSRMSYFVAKKLNVPVYSVDCLTLGSHGETMVPVISKCKVRTRDGSQPLRNLLNDIEIEEICNRTRDGGTEIVSLLKTGSAYFCPASAACKMAKAIMLDSKEILPCHSFVNGQYGLEGLYIGVEAEISRQGATVIESSLSENELKQLKLSSEIIKSKQKTLLESLNNLHN